MKKTKLFPIYSFLVTVLLGLSFLLTSAPLYAQTESSRAAQYLYKIAKDYYDQGDYRQALHEFKKVLLIEPGDKGARKYIGQILAAEKQKELRFREMAMAEAVKEGRDILRAEEATKIEKKERREIISLALEREQGVVERSKEEAKEELLPKKEKEKIELAKVFLPTAGMPEEEKKIKEIKAEEIRRLELSEELWKAQPKTTLKIELDKSLIIEGRTIARYLVENPKKIEIKRLNSDRVIVTAKDIGSTFLFLWEDRGRWVFDVKVISPYLLPAKEKILVFGEEPFKFSYTADWQSYYKKNEGEKFQRRTLSFSQWAGLSGPTPYGDFDASLRANKYGKEHKVTNYTAGLTEGKLGNFENFNIRGFDFYERFSELSYPGELLKGVSLGSDAFNKNINYTVFKGRERGYAYLIPGVLEDKKTYLEGVRLSLFPYGNKTYSFNYARGFGSDRVSYLKDRVYSFDGAWKFKDRDFRWEIAYDEDSFAGLLNSSFRFPDLDLDVNFRNIEKDFTTISGRPTNRGEIGSVVKATWRPEENLDLSSGLDVYRARYNYNEGAPKKLNFDWDSDLSLRLGESSSLVTSLSYINEPGLSFPRRYLSLRSTYSSSLEIFEKRIYPFLGLGFARSRNPLSVSSDYDTFKLLGGFRLPLTSSVSYRLNGEYNWLQEKYSQEKGNPAFLETGLDYRLNILPSLNATMSVLFREEENSELTHSFLSGEDSLGGSLRINFTPSKDTEFFLEGRLRQVWGESVVSNDYTEADFSLGLRSSWDTFFKWGSRGKISGIVFKDLNGNGKREDGEPFLESIKVKVGREDLTTDENGYFSTVVRGKKVLVRLDERTLPEGYILTTPSSLEVEISPVETRLNFGASSFSTIYGVVFYDTNSNGKFDPQDTLLPNVQLYLGEKPTLTNMEGSYYFKHLNEGKYVLKLDINSLPLEFIPSVPLKKEIALSEGVNYRYSFPLRKK